MTTLVGVFLAATAVGMLLTRVVRRLGVRIGAVDHALVSRKVHRTPIPRLGGVAIVAAFLLSVITAILGNSALGEQLATSGGQPAGLLVGALAIAALGVYDDLKGAGAPRKLLVQIASAALVWWCGFRIDHVATPFTSPLNLGVFGMPFTVLWIVGVTNAMNLIDGLDGLAAGVALVATTLTLVVSALHGDVLMVIVAAALAGATVGFLFFNFNPASIFMGDTGSMFLGFVLATTAIRTYQTEPGTVALVLPVIALGVPIADTLLAMARRAARGVPMFCGDAGHVHHRLLRAGFSHRTTVLVLHMASVVLATAAFVLSITGGPTALLVLMVLAAATALALRRLGFIRWDDARELMDQRRRNLMMREVVRRAGKAARQAQEPEEIWEQVHYVARALKASSVGFGIGPSGDEIAKYSRGFGNREPEMLKVRYGLTPERPSANYIELGWTGRTSMDRDSEIAIELLCNHIAPVVARIEDAVSDERAQRKVVRLRA